MNKNYSYTDIISEYTNALQRIDELTQAPEDLFLLKPDPNTWSANEIFRHLRRFNNLYIRKIDLIIRESGLPVAEEINFKPKFISRLLIRFMEPPYKFKIPTLAPMYPKVSNKVAMQVSITDLKETNQMVIELIEELEEKRSDLNKIKGSHPVFKLITLNLTEFFLVMAAHQRRHFWQAEQTLYRLSGTKY